MAEKLKMHSINKVDENIRRIGELFPNCLTEVKDEDGKVIPNQIKYNTLDLDNNIFTWRIRKGSCECSVNITIDNDYAIDLQNKLDAYRELSKDNRTLHLVMVTTNGVAHNNYYNMVRKEINMDDLFT